MDKTTLAQLCDAAVEAQKNSYAPYSKFNVGASILTSDNTVFQGVNVENAAFPSGQCAESSAIGTMVTAGHREIQHVVVASPNEEFCYPCGNCRQKIAEFANPDTQVTMITSDGKTTTVSMTELLPHTFSLDTD